MDSAIHISSRPSCHQKSIVGIGELAALCGGRLGVHDTACPLCGPVRTDPKNRIRRTLRVWFDAPDFATFHCARCGEHGYVRDRDAAPIAPKRLRAIRAEQNARDRDAKAERLAKAQALWRMRRPIEGSLAERYLREARGYDGPLPPTLAFLPARDGYPPSMLAAFGLAQEPDLETFLLSDGAVTGVHVTRLAPDGRGKAGTDRDKFMIGHSASSPIALAPFGEASALAVAEGIEDALSIHAATGLPAWAAGSASRLPALAAAVPSWVRTVTVIADADEAGRRGARALATSLDARGVETIVSVLSGCGEDA